jgi:hypothetical protein
LHEHAGENRRRKKNNNQEKKTGAKKTTQEPDCIQLQKTGDHRNTCYTLTVDGRAGSIVAAVDFHLITTNDFDLFLLAARFSGMENLMEPHASSQGIGERPSVRVGVVSELKWTNSG